MSAMSVKHTPVPWTIHASDGTNPTVKPGLHTVRIRTAAGSLIDIMQDVSDSSYPEILANAGLIVRAVNAHGGLLAACEDMLASMELACGGMGESWRDTIRKARLAVAGAEGATGNG